MLCYMMVLCLYNAFSEKKKNHTNSVSYFSLIAETNQEAV